MIELLILWVFGSTTHIVEKPMHFGIGQHQFHLQKPISAVNLRAGLEIDISSMLKKSDFQDMDSASNFVAKRFPKGCLKATLHGQSGATVPLEFVGLSFSPVQVFLRFGKPGSIPTGKKFHSLKLYNCTPFNSVTLRWSNAGL